MLTTSRSVEPYLEKVLTSAEFSRAKRMARFLRFVVEESLAGRGEELKERQIGIEVFDRPVHWDPKVDNIVRSEARRLRTKLEVYYDTAGKEMSSGSPFPKAVRGRVFRNQPASRRLDRRPTRPILCG